MAAVNNMRSIHPGEILREEYLVPLVSLASMRWQWTCMFQPPECTRS